LISSLAELNRERFKLHFSIDHSPNQNEIVEAIEELSSLFHIGVVIKRDSHLGLQDHMIECIGNLASFENGGVLLEDDLFVDSTLIDYLDTYAELASKDVNISSLGLYHQHYYHQSALPFIPYGEGPYLMQFPCSSGLYLNKENALELYTRLMNFEYDESAAIVPRNVLRWNDSWKKLYCMYLVLEKKYVLYPQRSVVTNTGATGVHHRSSAFYQSPMGYEKGRCDALDLANLKNRYDVFMEPEMQLIKSIQPLLSKYDFDVDLEGTRSLSFMRKNYLLSTKPCEKPIFRFSHELRPLVHNLKFQNKNGGIYFGLRKDFLKGDPQAYVKRFEAVLPPMSKRLLLKMLWRQMWR
jgi:hypothetical protein